MSDTIRPSEIFDILKARIKGFDSAPAETETGRIIQAGDGIATAWGLDNILSGELVEIDVAPGKSAPGMVMNLEEETVGIILFSDYTLVKEGQLVRRTGRVAEVPVGESLLGRVVDPLGNPLDGRGPLKPAGFRKVETKGPGIVDRKNVSEPLQTGIKAIDAMIPVGRGQRELIIGDRRTGKTTIAVDTILNQKNLPEGDRVFCFYVAIGQKRSSTVQLIETFRKHGVLDYTTVVAATASDPASLQYLAPYAATAMAEYFRDSGRHALVIFDDLTKHSQAYRELSLLMRRSPGREAFPGDIFYLHSRLLERAAKMSDEKGGGSLTALPIVETQEGDVSAYIPTNVISITDGQIFLESDLFNSGLRPAINVGISVSRVGGDAQIKAMKQTASTLRIDLAQFRELAAFMQFSSDLDPATKAQLARGERLTEILKQPQYDPVDVFSQIMILRAGITGRLDKYPTAQLLDYQKELFEYLENRGSAFMAGLRAAKGWTDGLYGEADALFADFERLYSPDKSGAGADAGYTLNIAMALGQKNKTINRDMLRLVERMTSRELAAPDLADEIGTIMSNDEDLDSERFDRMLESCEIYDYEKSANLETFFRDAAGRLEKRFGKTGRKVIFSKLVEREKQSSTAINPYFALPHIVVEGEGRFEIMVARSKKGIEFSEDQSKVHTIFFLAGSMDQRHFHLIALSALARIAQDPEFAAKWLMAPGPDDLRRFLISLENKHKSGRGGADGRKP